MTKEEIWGSEMEMRLRVAREKAALRGEYPVSQMACFLKFAPMPEGMTACKNCTKYGRSCKITWLDGCFQGKPRKEKKEKKDENLSEP